MRPEPLISIVIPAWNGARFLHSATECVAAQQHANLEVLLIDDGSTDGLSMALQECPAFVRYFRQERKGPAAARNRGIQESNGNLIGFLDIDDLWTGIHLRTLLEALESNPEAGIAQGMMCHFWSTAEGKYRRTEPYRMPYLGSCLLRRSVFTKIGLFDEQMLLGEDHDFFYRCWENDVLKVNVPQLSLLYRRHANTYSSGRNHEAHLLTIKRRIERIRMGVTDPAAPRIFAFQDYIGDREQVSDLSSIEVSECALRSA